MQEYPFPLQLKRSARAKRLRLIVKVTGAECVMPAAFPEHKAWAFIQQHRDWLAVKYREAVAGVPPRTFWDDLANGHEMRLPIQGRSWPLHVTGCTGGRSRLRVAEESFELYLPERHKPDWKRLGERALFDWARGWLAERAGEWVRHHQGKASLRARDIRIKRMRTRWGSCGARNDINLNWLLTFAPSSVLEYVVVHELCHIRHRDHSVRFWTLVGAHLPAYAAQRSWLKEHGRSLMYRFDVTGP